MMSPVKKWDYERVKHWGLFFLWTSHWRQSKIHLQAKWEVLLYLKTIVLLRIWEARKETRQKPKHTESCWLIKDYSTVTQMEGAGIHETLSFHHIQTGIFHNEGFCRDLQWIWSHPHIKYFVCFKMTRSFPGLINEQEMEVKGNK